MTAGFQRFSPDVSRNKFKSCSSLPTTLKIYDVNGKLVKDLSQFTNYDGHSGQIIWNGRYESGQLVGNGVYFLKFEFSDFRATEKVILVR
uniref:T9SS type A sorting domain-containing protein n=1 Tax=candidate division WOR-3 bacterium TaxID=2052148 RepID=A0A7V3VVB8_UNCW3